MAERKTKAAEEKADETSAGEQAKAPPKARTAAAAPLAAPEPKETLRPEPSAFHQPNATMPHLPHQASQPALLNADGKEISPDDVLTYPDPKVDPSAMVTVNQRVFRRYVREGTTTSVTDLAYPAGARISTAEANRFRAEFTPASQDAGG